MKIATIVVRVLMGLMFLFASVTYLFHLVTPPPMTGPIDTFNKGLEASRYMMPLVKVLELLCGLAVLVILPIIVNIVCVHAFMEPSGLVVAIPLALCELFLIARYRESYKPILEA